MKFILKLSLLIFVCFLIFVITSGVLFKENDVGDKIKEIEYDLELTEKNIVDGINSNDDNKNGYSIVKYKNKKSNEEHSLSTDFDLSESENLYVYSEGDMTVKDVDKVLNGVVYREEVSKALEVNPVALKGAIREEAYLIGYADNYEVVSKELDSYKEDIENGFLSILVIIKYDEERVVKDIKTYSKNKT